MDLPPALGLGLSAAPGLTAVAPSGLGPAGRLGLASPEAAAAAPWI